MAGDQVPPPSFSARLLSRSSSSDPSATASHGTHSSPSISSAFDRESIESMQTSDFEIPFLDSLNLSEERTKYRREMMLDDDVVNVRSFETRKIVKWKMALYYFFSIITAGIVSIVSYWPFCARRRAVYLSTVCAPKDADFAIVESTDGSFDICDVEEISPIDMSLREYWDGSARQKPAKEIKLSHRMISFRHTRYIYSHEKKSYVPIGPEQIAPATSLEEGLSTKEAGIRLNLFGQNLIDVAIPPIPVLLIRECIHPFVIFQIWAVIVWLTEQYWSFSAFIFVSAIATAVMNLRELRSTLMDIRRLSRVTVPVEVIRDGRTQQIESSRLVPGDVLVVRNKMKLPCDCVLVAGSATVTEAMLTGEATVVVKQPLPSYLSSDSAALPEMRNTLFGGTQVVELRRGFAHAIVVRTAFETVKGRLVLSVLHPKAPPFKFLEQSLRFIGLLFALALVGFAVNAKALHDAGASAGQIVQRGCDMITIVVPPALPLAVTVGTMYALVALKRRRVLCISPPRINLAGKVNCVVFDKTGTLTTEGLQLAEIRPAQLPGPLLLQTQGQTPKAQFLPPVKVADFLDARVRATLALCHGLTRVDGELAGDPLELETFAFAGALLDDSQELPHISLPAVSSPVAFSASFSSNASTSEPLLDAVILKEYEFSAALARMGVVARLRRPHAAFVAAAATTARVLGLPSPDEGAASTVLASFVKGAPEAIAKLCDPSSLPDDFGSTLHAYARRGLRVLACGYRAYPDSEIVLEQMLNSASSPGSSTSQGRTFSESSLVFAGLVVLENRLKPQSQPTMRRLQVEAKLQLHMCTGDHSVAAVAIARDVGLLQPQDKVYIADLVSSAPPTEGGTPSASKEEDVNDAFKSGGDRISLWNVDDPNDTLDPFTLLPAAGSASSSSNEPFKLAMTGRALQFMLSHSVPEEFSSVGGGLNSGQYTKAVSSSPLLRAVSPDSFQSTPLAVEAGVRSLPRSQVRRLILNCPVVARASPEQKALLIEELQALGMYVAMVGDGANDTLALRAAHVGVSLSQVEASVAAPFTYNIENPSIDCVPLLLSEGRAALKTSFSLFQFLSLYSTIQFSNALLIVFGGSFLSNNMYLYQDLWIVFVLSLTLGGTPANPTLTRKRPSGRLFSAHNLLITMFFILLTFLSQLLVFLLVRKQDWYDSPQFPAKMNPDDDPEGTNSRTPETTTVFLMASIQYVACAMIFSVGAPWKRSPLFNKPFVIWLSIVAASALALFLWQQERIYHAIDLMVLPREWNMSLLAISFGSFVLYFVLMGAMALIKKAGYVAVLEDRFFRGPRSKHKAIRAFWKAKFAAQTEVNIGTSNYGSGGVVNNPINQIASRSTRIARINDGESSVGAFGL